MNLRLFIILVVLLSVLAVTALVYGRTRGPDAPGASLAGWTRTLETLFVQRSKRPLNSGEVQAAGGCLEGQNVRLRAGGSCLLVIAGAGSPVRTVEVRGDTVFAAVLEQSQRVTVRRTDLNFSADVYRDGGTLSLTCPAACTLTIRP